MIMYYFYILSGYFSFCSCLVLVCSCLSCASLSSYYEVWILIHTYWALDLLLMRARHIVACETSHIAMLARSYISAGPVRPLSASIATYTSTRQQPLRSPSSKGARCDGIKWFVFDFTDDRQACRQIETTWQGRRSQSMNVGRTDIYLRRWHEMDH
jgi:hypothetical protein